MKAKFVNEDITHLLKPKSEKEIEDSLSNLSGDDLYDLYTNTDNKEYIKRAIKKGISNLNCEDISNILFYNEDLENDLYPLIIKTFPYQLKKNNNNYYMLFNWEDLSDLFVENSHVQKDFFNDILSGDSAEYFHVYASDIDLSNYLWEIQHFNEKEINKNIVNNIIKIVSKECKNNGIPFNNITNIEQLFKFILNNQNELKIKKIVGVLKIAICNVQEIADFDEAFNQLTNLLKNNFNLKNIITEDNYLKVLLNKDQILNLFKTHTSLLDKIYYIPPQYGFTGDFEKYGEYFIEEFYSLLQENLNESIK